MNYVQPIREKEHIEAMKRELLKKGMRDYLLFIIGINTGLRVSDILRLRVSDVRGVNGHLRTRSFGHENPAVSPETPPSEHDTIR